MRQAVEAAERELPPANGPHPAPSSAPAPLPATPPGQLILNPNLRPAQLSPPAPVEAAEGDLSDPFEPVNGVVMAFNTVAMRYVLDPVVDWYRRTVPASGQRAVYNFFRNLREPVNIAGAVLQGEWNDAQMVLSRFVINSTLGIGGLVDQASVLGFNSRVRTVDQAFCRWGVGPGPYVVLPLLGPSSARDTVARAGVLTAQAVVLGLWVIPYRLADTLAQYATTQDTWAALMTDQPDDYRRLRAIYQLYTQLPCAARNAADNGLFFQ